MENIQEIKGLTKKEYFKKYYLEHPEKYKINNTELVLCNLCNCHVKKNNVSHHRKTRKHELNYIRTINNLI
jgi:hypothetical protein